jgi:hypothetical protein
MLIHVVPSHALATYGAQGGAPPAASFDASGYNTAFYAWKSGGDGSGYWNGHRNRGYCNNYLRNGGSAEEGDASCRPHDPYYNEWRDLDDSPVSWSTTEPVDPTGVDSWLNNVGGGVYKARPTQLLRLFVH